MLPEKIDVVVVGAGNAAMSTALAAAEKGCSVQVLERAPEEECGVTFTFGGLKIDKQGRVIDRMAGRSPAYMLPASWWAGCFISTIPAAAGSCRTWCRPHRRHRRRRTRDRQLRK